MKETELKKIVRSEARKLFKWAYNKSRRTDISIFKVLDGHIDKDGYAHIKVLYKHNTLFIDEFKENRLFKYTQYTTVEDSKTVIHICLRHDRIKKLEGDF